MPRKTLREVGLPKANDHASMRPRPDAAENPIQRYVCRLVVGASMRPRPDAAENDPRKYVRFIHRLLQ